MAIHLRWRDGGLALRVKRRIPPPLHCSLATLIRWYRPKKPLQAESTGTENDLRYFSTTGYYNLPMGLPVQILVCPRLHAVSRSDTRKEVVQAHCQGNSEHHLIGFSGNTGVRIARVPSVRVSGQAGNRRSASRRSGNHRTGQVPSVNDEFAWHQVSRKWVAAGALHPMSDRCRKKRITYGLSDH